MDLGISKRVAVVTAASRGLGLAVARRLAAEGARVAICARERERLNAAAEEIGADGVGEVFAYPCDVTAADQVEAFLAAVSETLGGPDILVVNAGGPPPGTFETLHEAQWQAAFDLTLLSAARLVRAVFSGMRQRGWGRILFMVSISAKQPLANLILSNSIRAAVVGMAKTLADEVAAHGVLVNCLCPGFIRTDRMEQVIRAQAEAAGVPYATRLNALLAAVPLKRLGEPEEFADFAAFLVSERASFITGATFWADGGLYRGIM